MAAPVLDQASTSVVLRPPRLNFAQVCLYCDVRWCDSPSCVAMHERSVWRVCARCDGFAWITPAEHCTCLNGLEEATPEMAEESAGRLFPDRPAWHFDHDEDDDEGDVVPVPVASFGIVGGPKWPGALGW